MEEFKNFCASLKDAPNIVEKIDILTYTSAQEIDYTGADCLQHIADDVAKLNA